MSLTLVVMAAGLGSRFGGTKQLAEIGANGEAFLDLAIRDATAAGMGKVVLIIRSDIEADVRAHVARHHDGLDIGYVLQDTFGPSRDKPWGTGHAVLAAAARVDGAFVVVNADDYYGRSTYRLLCDAALDLPADRALLAGFRLDQTSAGARRGQPRRVWRCEQRTGFPSGNPRDRAPHRWSHHRHRPCRRARR